MAQQQQQFYPSSPNHGEFHGYHYVEASGSNNLGMQLNGTHPLHHLDHLDDPHSDPIPHIYEQTPESDGGYNDLTLLSDPINPHMDSMLHNQFVTLGIHSPTQPPPAEYAPYLPPSASDFPPAAPQPPSVGSNANGAGSRQSPTPLNLANLPPYLSPNHSPHHSPNLGASPSSELTPNSDQWESSSNLSFDGTSSPPDGLGGAQLRRSVSAGSGSAPYGEGKSYRRNIEKKSRDKKTTAYMRLKKELEDISHKNYGQRCQAEVLDGAAALLASKAEENRRLQLENQVYRDKLKQYGLWQTD